jgi:hypothetical protein
LRTSEKSEYQRGSWVPVSQLYTVSMLGTSESGKYMYQ